LQSRLTNLALLNTLSQLAPFIHHALELLVIPLEGAYELTDAAFEALNLLLLVNQLRPAALVVLGLRGERVERRGARDDRSMKGRRIPASGRERREELLQQRLLRLQR
jgi:hypothetical protein